MTKTLYEKVEEGGKTYYRVVIAEIMPDAPVQEAFSNGELITLGASLGMMVLMQMEKLLPAHSRNARKIRAVNAAILDLVKGSGAVVTDEMCNYWADTWNLTMRNIQQGIVTKLEEQKEAA